MKVLFVMPNKDVFGYKPIALALLSALSKRLGWETKLFDTTGIDFGFSESKTLFQAAKIFKPVDFTKYDMAKKKVDLKEEFTNVFKDYNPDILAFSVLSDQFIISKEISETAKRLNPNIVVIWGGAHATLDPENVLKNYGADFVCLGEGLEAFPEFLSAFKDGKDLYNIKNIWGIRNGEIIKNDLRPLKQNLDDLPYLDWDIFDKRHFYKPFSGKVYIGGDHMLNWGCVNNCTYCINNFYHNLYAGKKCAFLRRYSPKRIVEELKYLEEKYGIEFFKFFDEDFLLRPLDSLKELSELYKKEVNVPFSIETNPKFVDRERVALLKNMNCVNASLGVETGDLKARKEILGRIDSEEDIVRAFTLLREAGIKTSSFNMLGLPFESREAYKKTIEINRKANPQYPQCGFFYPFKGTKLRDISISLGLFDDKNKDTAIWLYDKPALHFKHLTEDELVEMRNVFVFYIKLPREYEPFIRRSEKRDEIGTKLRNKISEIYDKTVWANDGWYADDGFKENYLAELKQITDNIGSIDFSGFSGSAKKNENGFKNYKNVPYYFFGKGSVSELKNVLSRKRVQGLPTVFLVDEFFTDKNVQNILSLEPADILIFVSTKQEPKAEYIDEITDGIKSKFQKGLPSAIIGMGGGTVMDISKCVSILLTNPGKAEDYQGWNLVKNPGVYKIGIPTISGTGAETSRTGVFTSKKVKLGMNSEYSMFDQIILDPEFLKTVPKEKFIYTAMDCYAHDVELLKGNDSQLTKVFAASSLNLLRGALKNPQKIDYEKLMLSSYLGGIAMGTASGGHVCHPTSYGLSFVLGLRHGISVCMAFNALEEYYGDFLPEFRDIFFRFNVNLPKGVTKDATEQQIEEMAQATLKNEKPLESAFGKNWREVFTKEKVKEILRRI